MLLTPFLLFCIVPGLFAPHDPLRIEAIPLQGPSRTYWLGTDEVGRDLLSRSIYAARNDVLVSLASAFIAFTLGTTIGLFSGYVGGKVDTVMMRVVDVLLSFPTIVLALFLIVVIGREQWVQVLAIALVMMPSMARFSRGTGLVLRNRGYVEAARLAGASRRHVLRHHVLPNSLPTLLVAASVLAASAVLISASLSYLGLGAQPPDPSWGNMLRSAYSVRVPGAAVRARAGRMRHDRRRRLHPHRRGPAPQVPRRGLRRRRAARAADVRPGRRGPRVTAMQEQHQAATTARSPVGNALEIAALSVNYRAGSSSCTPSTASTSPCPPGTAWPSSASPAPVRPRSASP